MPSLSQGCSLPTPRGWSSELTRSLWTADLGLALSSAEQSGTPLPLGTLTRTLYSRLAGNDSFKDRDFSVIYEYLQQAMEGGFAEKMGEKKGKKQ